MKSIIRKTIAFLVVIGIGGVLMYLSLTTGAKGSQSLSKIQIWLLYIPLVFTAVRALEPHLKIKKKLTNIDVLLVSIFWIPCLLWLSAEGLDLILGGPREDSTL